MLDNGIISKNLEKYLQMKREYILNRLLSLKKSKLDYFEMFHTSKEKGDSMLENFKTYKPSNIKEISRKKDKLCVSEMKSKNYSFDFNMTNNKSYLEKFKKGKDLSHLLDSSKPTNISKKNKDQGKTTSRICLWDKLGISKGNLYNQFSSRINFSRDSISSIDDDNIQLKSKPLRENLKVMNVAVETENAKSSDKKEFLISKVDCLAMDNINILKNSKDLNFNKYLDQKIRPKSFTKINVKKPLPMILYRKERKKILSKGNFVMKNQKNLFNDTKF
jgi:hypothetical protein